MKQSRVMSRASFENVIKDGIVIRLTITTCRAVRIPSPDSV